MLRDCVVGLRDVLYGVCCVLPACRCCCDYAICVVTSGCVSSGCNAHAGFVVVWRGMLYMR